MKKIKITEEQYRKLVIYESKIRQKNNSINEEELIEEGIKELAASIILFVSTIGNVSAQAIIGNYPQIKGKESQIINQVNNIINNEEELDKIEDAAREAGYQRETDQQLIKNAKEVERILKKVDDDYYEKQIADKNPRYHLTPKQIKAYKKKGLPLPGTVRVDTMSVDADDIKGIVKAAGQGYAMMDRGVKTRTIKGDTINNLVFTVDTFNLEIGQGELFKTAKFQLNDNMEATIRKQIRDIKNKEDFEITKVIIYASTDTEYMPWDGRSEKEMQEDPTGNIKLANERAKVLKKICEEEGINPNLIKIELMPDKGKDIVNAEQFKNAASAVRNAKDKEELEIARKNWEALRKLTKEHRFNKIEITGVTEKEGEFVITPDQEVVEYGKCTFIRAKEYAKTLKEKKVFRWDILLNYLGFKKVPKLDFIKSSCEKAAFK